MIIVTGGAGFIGSNLIKLLNQAGHKNIVAVDDLTDGTKFANLVDLDIADYMDKDEFIARVVSGDPFEEWDEIEVVFHQGACSATTEWNGKFMLENNFTFSKYLLHYCQDRKIPFMYASSASVYGGGSVFAEDPRYEKPLNVYGYSKMLFDNYVRRHQPHFKSQVVGLRYFNVYGPREMHKGAMASVAFHLYNQLKTGDKVRLFAGCDGYADGGQLRDFVYVEDIVGLNLWFWRHPEVSGIFNAGTGRAQSFNDVANAVIKACGKGEIEYIPFPEHLKGHYQSYTQADLTHLRSVGCEKTFKNVEEGVAEYIRWLQDNNL